MTLPVHILARVEKPGRYSGGELNQIVKERADVRVALCFPDVYEVAMSHTGLRVLYHCINEHAEYAAERCYAPWPDLEAVLRETGDKLWTLETHQPLAAMDCVGFSLQYELSYPNLLNMLELGGVAVRSRDRDDAAPLVIAGGSGAFNPEPLADFVDAFLIGEGEDAIVELCAVLKRRKDEQWPRVKLLEEVAKIRGMYVPTFFDFSFAHGGAITAITPKHAWYPNAEHRQVVDLDRAPFPTKPLVPNVQIVHDRVGIEVQRGCTKGCRFCQAGMIFRPTRQRNPETVLKIAEESLESTGQDEVSFLSLSIGDYEPLQPLLRNFFNRYDAQRVGVSLPSLRTETLTQDVVNEIARGKKHSFTLAPEAGSDRMRRIINKGNTEENLMRAVDTAIAAGWDTLKYYFMIGLPYEIQDDVDAIAHLGLASRERARRQGKKLNVTVSVSSFVPKPHTPFQWEPQIPEPEIRRHQDALRDTLKKGGAGFRYHNAGQTLVEGVISRGDRRVGDVIYAAWKLGCRLDAWDEHFDLTKWMQAFDALKPHGLEWQWFHRRRELGEILPWDAVDSGVSKRFLMKELARAHKEAEVEDCAWGKCYACSACDFKTVEPLAYPRDSLAVTEALPRAPQPTQVTIVRVRFAKDGLALYLSHLEHMEALLRACRRARLDVVYSQGFSPRPKISFSPALPFRMASTAEYMDIELAGVVEPAAVLAALTHVAPSGVRFMHAETIDKHAKAVAHAINTMTFAARVPHEIVVSGTVERVRDGKGKRFDLAQEIATERRGDELFVTIHQRSDGTLKIEEVARALGIPDAVWSKVDVGFGEQLTSSAVPFKTVAPPRVRRDRDEPRRDDAELLKNAPFAER